MPYGSPVPTQLVFSEHELTFTFRSLMLSPVRLSIVCLSVTFVHRTQSVERFDNVSMSFGTLAIR